MPNLLALALLIAPSAAPADDFQARVLQGRLAEADRHGPAYQKQLWARIGTPMTDAMKACIVRHAPADKSPFTLVADVAADGHTTRIEVQPATPLASCLAEAFARWPLPAPPATPRPYPIEIDVSVAP